MIRSILFVDVTLAIAFVEAALAQGPGMGQGQGHPPGKVVLGTITSIDASAGTVTIQVEKYVARGQDEVDAEGKIIEASVGEKTKFKIGGETAEIGAYSVGDEVAAVVFEWDDKVFLLALMDRASAKKMFKHMGDKQGMQGKHQGRMGGHGMMQGKHGRDGQRHRGIPLYGEVLELGDGVVIISPEAFPMDKLGVGGEGCRHKGAKRYDGEGHRGMKMLELLPERLRIEITDDTKVFLGGEEASLDDLEVGGKYIFQSMPPKGDWSRENLPDYFIAKRIADVESAKVFFEKTKSKCHDGKRQQNGRYGACNRS